MILYTIIFPVSVLLIVYAFITIRFGIKAAKMARGQGTKCMNDDNSTIHSI